MKICNEEHQLFTDFVVLASGVVEIAFGLGIIFLVAKKRAIAGALLALFYVAIFPGNINQYVNHIDAFGLNTDNLRLIRLFFQPVLIFLALWTTGGWKYWKLWAKGKFFAETSAKRLSTYGAQESGKAEHKE